MSGPDGTVSIGRPPSVLVIGAGVAGSVCAIRLKGLGIATTLAEKASFPREKTCGCCLSGAGLKTLGRLGLREWVEEHGTRTERWLGSLGGRRIELAVPGGVAISRSALDTFLCQQAAASGVSVHMSCTATLGAIDGEAVEVTLTENGMSKIQAFDAVIVAAGLNASGLQQQLPWQHPPHGPFGVSFTADCENAEPGVIYMACDDDGYVGGVRLENGRVDFAAALRSGSEAAAAGSPVERISRLLTRSRLPALPFTDPSDPLATPPLRRHRLAGKGRVLAIGDAAGYVEPFTGEGMAWAAQSGLEAAQLVADSQGELSRVGDDWCRRMRSCLRGKKWACRAITAALRSPGGRRTLAAGLTYLPLLARPVSLWR